MSAPERLAPIPVEEWSDEARETLATHMSDAAKLFLSGAPDAPRVPNVIAVLMHHPKLAGPWLTYNGVLLNEAALDPKHRELMILRVAWRTRSEYEWVQHVRLGRQLGITDDEIETVADSGTHTWSPLEADLLDATDQLLDQYCIDDETWARLAQQLDERQLFEVVFAVGSYTCLSMAFKSFGFTLDPELVDYPAPSMPTTEE
jgi:4-carboxymuconolactone decarboxylase